MLHQKVHFSVSVMNYPTPCTSSEGRLCTLFEDLHVWNAFFCKVGLQMREFSPGQLSLVQLRCVGDYPNILEQRRAATLLCHLLSHHRCIVSVNLNASVFEGHEQITCDALRISPSLRKLKFCQLNMKTDASQSFVATLPHLDQLQELDISDVPFNRTSLEGLSEFLASTRSLTTLTMTDQRIEGEDAAVILQGLMQNVTISALSLHMSLLSVVSPRCGEIFTDYLRSNQTLRSLTVTSHSHLCFNDLGPIIGALFYNSTLSELKLIGFSIDTRRNNMITGMLSRNRGLRRFHMVSCTFYEYDLYLNTWVFSSGSGLTRSRLAALAENNTLEELTMDLCWVKPEDCSSVFRALACHASLKKVNVPTFSDKDVAQICRTLRDTGMLKRFFLGEHRVSEDTVVQLPECKELSCISVFICDGNGEPLHTTLRLLPTCSHVKSLCLSMTGLKFNGEVSSLIVQYITSTTALRELRLVLLSWNRRSVDGSERPLLQALYINKSIRRLSLTGFCIREGEATMLADTLQSSLTLCHLSFYPCNHQATIWFIRKLSPNISSNYMLLGMRTCLYERLCDGWFAIIDVVRRNNSLVTRAAHFVMGTRHKYCAAAAELVRFHPGLLKKVQELASVDENEAVSRIKSSLKSLFELEDFMCLAEVVKDTLSCHMREDGKKQLVDLNNDCWLHIRQYLKVGDIPDSK
ncbi:hypothetical protein HPB52_003649 [Rhipicephalus sanguineus]|uniref:Uncharacterized protein n=1 Tax=Rhipicephalus sanguineus TaxID=34632 RepID=A0A9D4Q9R4_RHISA|nr:hypothetical protein HPB52_003649 [Rhipicephalus sanguineus]